MRTVAGRLEDGQAFRYRLSVPKGSMARVRIDEDAGNVAVVVRDLESGRHLMTLDAPWSNKAAEEALLDSGEYCIQVLPSPQEPCARHRFRIRYETRERDRDSSAVLAVQACEAWGQALLNQGGHDEQALTYFESALAHSRRFDADKKRASLHHWLGVTQARLGRRKEALENFDAATALHPRGWLCADSLLWKSSLRYDPNRLADEAFRETILGLLAQALDQCPNSICRAQVQSNRVRIQLAAADFLKDRRAVLEDSKRLALVARETFHQHGEMALEATSLTGLGTLVQELGAPQEAMGYFDEGLAIYRQMESRCEVPKSLLRPKGFLLNNAGLALSRMGRKQEAETYYRQAIDLAKSIDDKGLAATSLNNLGSLYIDTNDPVQARELLQEALRSTGLPRGLKTTALNNLARVHEAEAQFLSGAARLKSFHLARDLYEKALANLDKFAASGRANPSEEATVRSNLGSHHLAAGDPQSALAQLDKALKLRKDLHDQVGQYRTELKLGRAFSALGRDEQALRELGAALDLSQNLNDPVTSARARLERAKIYLRRNRLGAAREDLGKALAVVESQRLEVSGEYRKSSYFSAFRPVYELSVSLLLREGHTGEAFEMSERSRARSLLDTLRLGQVKLDRSSDQGLAQEKEEVLEDLYAKTDLQERLRRKFKRPNRVREGAALELDIERLVSRLRAIDAKRAARHPRRRAILEAPKVTLAEIQSIIKPDTLLLEYFVSSDETFLWVVGTSLFKVFSVSAGLGDVESMVQSVYDAVKNQSPSYQESLKRAGRLIPRDLLEDLEGKRLAVVLDGPLHFLPFGLLGPSDGPALFESNDLIYLPSASYILEQRRSRAARHPNAILFVIADPTYRDRGRLLASDEEAKRIRAIAGRSGELEVDLRLGPQARIAALGEAASSRFIHFALHGRYDSRYPELSSLLLSDTQDHGRLGLQEIYKLHLESDLVVLNGCETALGPLMRGEGMLSLTRGFLHAGAKQVMASLWRVQDQASARFAELFYQGLLSDSLSPAASLRQAKTKMKSGRGRDRQWRHPYYWATFVLYGDWQGN